MLLEVESLNIYYGQLHICRNITLRIDEGQIVALLGSNGAGKTTTLRTLSGLHRSSSGRIVFRGTDITRLPAHEIVRRGFAHVPEGRRVFAPLTVDENLTVGGYLDRGQHDSIRERRRAVYELFPALSNRRKQLAGTLSGGEQQMLAVGRALMTRPKLIALDEPSLGLAPRLAHRILTVLRRLAGDGIAVLLVEQNAREALRIADRAYVLETGSIVLDGAASELASNRQVQEAYLGGFSNMTDDMLASQPGGERSS